MGLDPKLFKETSHLRRAALGVSLAIFLVCTLSFTRKEFALTDTANLSPRLSKLFSEKKLVCFGRYAVEVPKEAKLILGGVDVPYGVEVFDESKSPLSELLAYDILRINRASNTAEITFNGAGPLEKSWQIRYFDNQFAKKRGALSFQTYVIVDGLIYVIGDSVVEGSTEAIVEERQSDVAKRLRWRHPDEVPNEPGYCLRGAFVPSDDYSEQEMAHAGIYLPSFPDVTFSMSSNKDAYSDYSPAEFSVYKAKLSLLYRIEDAKKDQGFSYPYRKVFREGARKVQHWAGEESLFRRKDGVHDFEWALVGEPRNVANPSELRVTMYTKVRHNLIGAANSASLSDSEAVALWDKLLSGIKFRVKVPGAPAGSYFLDKRSPGSK